MDQRLSAILEHLRQKRRTAWLESLIVLLLGLGLMLLFPATGVSAFVLHLGRAIGLVLSLVGFFWHRRVLRWPEPEEEPVLQALRQRPGEIVGLHLEPPGDRPALPGTPPRPRRLELEMADGERLALSLPPPHLDALLTVLGEVAPQALSAGAGGDEEQQPAS